MRLDNYIFSIGSLKSRTNASNIIKKGAVSVNGIIITKPSFEVDDSVVIEIVDEGFASMGGYKLDKALDLFKIDLNGKTAADIGASNGGFTDCMLRRGVKKVYAVDVANCQLPAELLSDKRVIVKDRINARDINSDDLGEKVDFATIDVSFISLTLVLGAVAGLIKEDGKIVALIKPQFEQGKKVGKSGIVTSVVDRLSAVNSIMEFAASIGLFAENICTVPRIFSNKNIEYPVLFTKTPQKEITKYNKESINYIP